MAVLSVDAATDERAHGSSTRAHPLVRLRSAGRTAVRPLHTVRHIATRELPDDVRLHECTVSTLFRGSLILNYLTGGDAEMTFSARCFRSQRISRHVTQRIAWRMVMHGIDLACAMLRGESQHCATAWSNYLARPVRRTRV